MDDVDEVEAELRDDLETTDPESPLHDFVAALQTEEQDTLRLVVRFDGDRHEVLFARDDVRASYGDREPFDDHVEALVLRGLSDPPDENLPFGDLDATARWFEDVLVVTFPTDEWAGVVATFDREHSGLVAAALAQLRDE
jgi:hypothetical protein